jgi:hypothetical protein
MILRVIRDLESDYVATPLWPSVRMKLTLPKLGTWSPSRLLNV